MSGRLEPGEVGEFADEHALLERTEVLKMRKGARNMRLRGAAMALETNQDAGRKSLERDEAMRNPPLTLPKLKFLDEPENEL
jgi:hypothetical protein